MLKRVQMLRWCTICLWQLTIWYVADGARLQNAGDDQLPAVITDRNLLYDVASAPLQRGMPAPEGESAIKDADKVITRVVLGRLIGRKVVLPNLPWSPDVDSPLGSSPREAASQSAGMQLNNVTVFTFLGIPYALPPVGNLRFQPPIPLSSLPADDIHTLNYKAACPQDTASRATLHFDVPYEFVIDEDCLYLNVFTPRMASSSKQYPVVVFFHGGGFQTGAANDWPGYVLASKGLVVVTANYRLGPLGFLSLGDRFTGNYGLMDQTLVLRWVSDNIYAFNGDPGQVTIVGHGSGAVSVGLHMLMKASEGLFQGAVAMSGADVSYHQVITNPMLAYNNTAKLGRQMGCTQAVLSDVWNCLLTRSPGDLIDGVKNMLIEYNRYAFLPVVDENVLRDSPERILRDKGVVSRVPYVTGMNVDDGSEVLLAERDLAKVKFVIDQKFLEYKILDYIIKRNYTTNREPAMEAIKYQYTYWPDPTNNDIVRQEFIQFASDAYYVAPITKAAKLRSEAGSMVFMYVNNYSITARTGVGDSSDKLIPDWMSVCHECDLYLLFGFPWMPKNLLPLPLREVKWSDSDRDASDTVMSMWKGFASVRNPNPPRGSSWANYAPRNYFYLNITAVPTLQRDYRWDHVAFWNVYINTLVNFFTTTFSPAEASLRKQLIGFQATSGVFIVLCAIAVTMAGTFCYMLLFRPKDNRTGTSSKNYTHIAHTELTTSL